MHAPIADITVRRRIIDGDSFEDRNGKRYLLHNGTVIGRVVRDDRDGTIWISQQDRGDGINMMRFRGGTTSIATTAT